MPSPLETLFSSPHDESMLASNKKLKIFEISIIQMTQSGTYVVVATTDWSYRFKIVSQQTTVHSLHHANNNAAVKVETCILC